MENVSDIQFEQDTIGRNDYVRIDLKERGLTLEEAKQEMHKRIDAWPDK